MNKQELKRLCKGLKVKETGMYTKGYNIGINAVLSTLLSVGNPPLRFEELEVGMWVWDNSHKIYSKVELIYNSNRLSLIDYCTRFEENRFYRYEVKENGE